MQRICSWRLPKVGHSWRLLLMIEIPHDLIYYTAVIARLLVPKVMQDFYHEQYLVKLKTYIDGLWSQMANDSPMLSLE